MSQATRTADPAALAAALAAVHRGLEPAEVYAGLDEALQALFGRPLAGAWVRGADGDEHLDPAAPTADGLPATIGEGAPVATLPSLTRFAFRGRPLGAVALAGDEPAPGGLAAWLEENFAPALFRAHWLSSTLAENSRSSEQLHYLKEMGKFLGELEPQQLLVNILELTSSFLGADVGSITLFEGEDGVETAVDWGLPQEAITSLVLRDGTGALARARETRQPLRLEAEELEQRDDAPWHFDRLLVLPLCTNNSVVGSINLVAPAGAEGFSEASLEAVRPGVGLAAIAVENALLVEIKLQREREQQQLAVGQQIQTSLLPKEPPQVEGVQMAASSVSATMIGGDYYDYFILPDGHLGLLVADVAGKGVPAGLIMTAARAMFRAAASRLDSPGEIINQVNGLMCQEDFGSRFVTVNFTKILPAAGKMVFASAGHEAPMIWRASTGEVEAPSSPSMPIGLRARNDYTETTVELGPGDSLVIYTDGVNEAMDKSRVQFGSERLAQVMREGAGDSAPALLDRILDAVNHHLDGQPRQDDTTLIVARLDAVQP